MASQVPSNEPHRFDDFLMTVITNDDCYIEWKDGDTIEVTAGQESLATFGMLYRGGTGSKRCTGWNIFWYDRSDANPHGTPDAPLDNLPSITEISPREPSEGRPSLTPDEQTAGEAGGTNGVDVGSGRFARLDGAGVLQTYHVGSFKSGVPRVGTNAGDIPASATTVTFRGRMEIVR